MTITPQWKDELRARVTLSTVVQRTTKLTRAGREWKACCPFHNENSPSFYVNDEKQFYHCFGCGAHGDVITWMIEQRGLSFMDAIRELAEEAGMEVPAPDPVAAKRAEKRAELVDVTTAAQDWFVEQLKRPEGRKALDYLRARGFTDATLREFGFGYAPEDKQALARALSQFDADMLTQAGMRATSEGGESYDRFRGRVMLPIQDQRGRVIAFGGRILEKREGVAKYLNSPDTPLFDKGRTLYNLHRASPAARQSGRVIVVEGYMDVIALAQAGFHDAVAPLGTALTETQLEMLWRMVEVPVLCFDGDAAGQRAAMRAVERALPHLRAPNSLRIIHLPGGLDPDDYIKIQGKDAFGRLISNATSLVKFIWESEKDATPLDTPEQKAYLRRRLVDLAFTIRDKELAKLYRSELTEFFYHYAYPDRFGKGRSENQGILSSENIARLNFFIEHGEREELLRACLSAIARKPELFDKFRAAIHEFEPPTVEISMAIDVFWAASEALDDGSALPSKLDEIANWKGPFMFPFLKKGVSDEFVEQCLHESFFVLIEKRKVERHLKQAILRLEHDGTIERELEVQRLVKVKQDVLARERQISRLTMQS